MSLAESVEQVRERLRPQTDLAYGARFPLKEYWPSIQEKVSFTSDRLAKLLAADEAAAEADLTTRANVRKVTQAMAVAALISATLLSDGLVSYTRDLPGNAVSDRLVRAADGWHQMMLALGPAELSQQIRDLTASVHAIGTGEAEDAE